MNQYGVITETEMGKTLAFIQRSVIERGYPPTRRELSDFLGHTSSSSGFNILAKMQRLGYVEVDPSIPRGVRITEEGLEMVARTVAM